MRNKSESRLGNYKTHFSENDTKIFQQYLFHYIDPILEIAGHELGFLWSGEIEVSVYFSYNFSNGGLSVSFFSLFRTNPIGQPPS